MLYVILTAYITWSLYLCKPKTLSYSSYILFKIKQSLTFFTFNLAIGFSLLYDFLTVLAFDLWCFVLFSFILIDSSNMLHSCAFMFLYRMLKICI